MKLVRDTFCSFCGTRHPEPLLYPRKCASCATEVWANPIPVSIVLQPVDTLARGQARQGLLVIRRAIEPGLGRLGLVGGFIEEHETWEHAGAREVREEVDLEIDEARLSPFWFTSTAPRPNRVLLFSLAPPLEAGALGSFTPNHETSERGLIFGPDGLEDVFAFALHIEAARRYFAQRGVTGPHDYSRA
jgi:ADP-ribose pyrophosphatase YjhB (NUDIX family)